MPKPQRRSTIAEIGMRSPPMACVIMGMRELDFSLRDASGELKRPAIVAFQDLGTGRIFPHIVELAPGETVRAVDAYRGLCAMRDDPAWGLPGVLFVERVGELPIFADIVRDSLRRLNDPALAGFIICGTDASIERAIEAMLATLDQHVFSKMNGQSGHA